MNTKMIYRENPYQKEFNAEVVSCVQEGEHYILRLDQTCFYPEGGGQPSDRGEIGGAVVVKVRQREDEIEHIIDRPLEPGAEVVGRIDWDYRFDLMQHHTAEHIVSGLINSMYGGENVGFHMGKQQVSIDFDIPLTQQQILEVELLANKMAAQNILVQERYPDREELADMSYRSKREIEGQVRIVQVPGVDSCACCGIHVASTAEVGMIKLLSAQKYKGGTRMGMMCGIKALEGYRLQEQQALTISQLLCKPTEEIAQGVEKLYALQEQSKGRIAELLGQIFEFKCAKLAKDNTPLCLFEQGLDVADQRRFADMLARARGGLCGVFTQSDDGFRYAICHHSAEDMRGFSREINTALSGRGGGDNTMVQGSVRATQEQIEAYFGGISAV